MSKRIEITVDSKGESTVETKGFAGSECIEASKFVEAALGKQTAQRTTPEFFHATTSQVQRASNSQN